MILDKWLNNKIREGYKKKLTKLQNEIKKRKIKIVFINCETSKWAYQYIYDIFAKDDRFDVQVLVSVYEMLLNKKYAYLNYENQLKKNYDFFKQKGMNVDYAYDFSKKKPIDLKEFAPDIIFYDEPRATAKIQSINKTCKYAIPMHCSYGSSISNNTAELDNTYKKLYLYFVDNSFIKELLCQNGFDDNQVCVAGQPKLDAYLKPINYENKIWKTDDKKHIIYAPHFSFDNHTELRFGTFDWNYKYFYDYAQKHPEYEFILKPHPSLKREIVKRGLMCVEDMERYFQSWAELPNAQVYEVGDYIDMFRTSDLLITDCNSFLYEYLPTQRPVIHLINKNSVGYNKFGVQLVKGYYKANNIDEINNYMDSILVQNQDSKLETRLDIINNYIKLDKGGIAQKILDYICKELRI